MSWARARERALNRLRQHLDLGLVDEDIRGFLERLNQENPCLFTTSSCSGRLVVLEGPSLFDKRRARIAAQTHDPSRCEHLLREALQPPARDRLRWVSLQPPILHIATATLEVAERIAREAERAGFSRACYKRYRHGGFHVEIAASDKLHIINPTPSQIQEACRALDAYKRKLEKLASNLLENPPCTIETLGGHASHHAGQ